MELPMLRNLHDLRAAVEGPACAVQAEIAFIKRENQRLDARDGRVPLPDYTQREELVLAEQNSGYERILDENHAMTPELEATRLINAMTVMATSIDALTKRVASLEAHNAIGIVAAVVPGAAA